MQMLYLITGVSLSVYVVLAFLAARFLGLQGSDFYILFAALTLIGAVAAAVVVWWRLRTGATELPPELAKAAESGSDEELDNLIRDAEAKLSASKSAPGAGLGSLPLVFIVGEPGATKTSIVVNSGLEPELLAGHVYQENQVAPTRTANVWLAHGAVFAEAAAKLLNEPARWVRMVRRLKPGSLKSVVGGNAQAPRAAVVCVSAEVFTQPGASDQLTALSRNLQARLGEVSQALGISFPVYVVFTKSDRLPFFGDYVRTLSNEEAGQVLGATLPLRTATSGVYAEDETQRLNAAFQALFHSLADKRVEYLPRESAGEKAAGAYEFPREFRKLRTPLVQFLVDLCRPSQLRSSPFLRGFYFAGVRPVIVQDNPLPAAPPLKSGRSFDLAGSATGVFHVPQMAQAAQPVMQSQFTGTKRVPQWVFLTRLFHQVILQDRAALGVSAASTKTSGLQRVLLACGALLCLLFAIGFTVSYFQNRALVNDAVAAAKAIPASEAVGANLVSLEALQKLETLRQELEQLTVYRTEGHPFRMGWGLYAGDAMYPHLRQTYYNRFAQLLFAQAQGNLKAHLDRLPAAPGANDDYGLTYEVLKGYLITTSNNDKVSDSSPAPILLSRWAEGRDVDAPRMQLAAKQFQFYARDLKNGNPYSSVADAEAVKRGRVYLSQFSGIERVYQFMLSSASKRTVNFNRDVKDSAQAVLNNRDVPGAFTKEGYKFMQDALHRADQFFGGERWVLGDYASDKIDRAKLGEQLSARYVNDFITQWRNYFKNTTVLRYADLKDAARKLNLETGSQSPILGLFWLASQNTGGLDYSKIAGADRIQKAFQPVHAVVPPGNVDRYVAPSNQPYMNGLVGLQASIDQAANMPVPDPATASNTLNSATQAKIAVKQVSQTFSIDQEAHLEGTVQKLLEDPITNAEALLRALGPAELNGKGKGLCAAFSGVTGKYPFNPSATAEATLQEVNGLLKPGEGALWAFYEANLKRALIKQGPQYVPTGEVPLNPAFVNFFNTAAKVSEAIYKNGAEPKLAYTLTPLKSEGVQSLTLTIDGQTLTAAGQGGAGKQFTWPGSGQGAKLAGKFGGPDLSFFSYDGLWAAFRLMGEAERWEPSGTGYNLEWVVRLGGKPVTLPSGAPLTVRFLLDMNGAPAFFKKGSLSGMRCVSQVAR